MGRRIGLHAGRLEPDETPSNLTPEQQARLAYLREWTAFRERSAGQYDTVFHDEMRRLEALQRGDVVIIDAADIVQVSDWTPPPAPIDDQTNQDKSKEIDE